ncbi:MAG TPA: FRG domain-containing protein [Steroidobacteraceae bacterium]
MAARRTKRSGKQTIGSWSELACLAEEMAGQDWIFRGEPSSRNPLRPSAGRLDREIISAGKTSLVESIERAALDRFKADAVPYLDYRPPFSHDLEWLAIAQHHGMQTRLLDWTESLLIAAFFAVDEGGCDGDALIYGVRGLPVAEPTADPFNMDEVCIYRPSKVTPRIGPQWSLFTVHPNPAEDFRSYAQLRKWRIPGRKLCAHIKLVLDACGINYASLYPDLTGLARHIYWRSRRNLEQVRNQRVPSAAPAGGGT